MFPPLAHQDIENWPDTGNTMEGISCVSYIMECVLYLAAEHIPSHPLRACCWAAGTASRKISGDLSSDFCYVVKCFLKSAATGCHHTWQGEFLCVKGRGDHNESDAALRAFQGWCRIPTCGNNHTWPAVLPPGEILADAIEKWFKLMGNGHIHICQGTDFVQKISSGLLMKKE